MWDNLYVESLRLCHKFRAYKFKFIVLGENKSNLAAETVSVILTAKTLKLPDTRKWLLQEELKMT